MVADICQKVLRICQEKVKVKKRGRGQSTWGHLHFNYNQCSGKTDKINFTKQMQLGWSYCIRGFLTTEWIEVAKLFETKKTYKEIVGVLIIGIWCTW